MVHLYECCGWGNGAYHMWADFGGIAETVLLQGGRQYSRGTVVGHGMSGMEPYMCYQMASESLESCFVANGDVFDARAHKGPRVASTFARDEADGGGHACNEGEAVVFCRAATVCLLAWMPLF